MDCLLAQQILQQHPGLAWEGSLILPGQYLIGCDNDGLKRHGRDANDALQAFLGYHCLVPVVPEIEIVTFFTLFTLLITLCNVKVGLAPSSSFSNSCHPDHHLPQSW
jgi:hypothetical protein